MTRPWSAAATGVVASVLAALPVIAQAQAERRPPPQPRAPSTSAPSNPGSSVAVPRGGRGGDDRARTGARAPEPTASGSGSSERPQAAARRRAPAATQSDDRPASQGGSRDSAVARPPRRYPTGGEQAHYAVPRASHPPSAIPGWGWHDNNGYGSGHWYRNYYRPSQWYWAPWGFGLGYWSYYDPWYAPAYAYGYGSGYYGSTGGYVEGSVRLKVAPRDAQVFVDGYYVGVVDDFDGNFQRLRLEEGPHRIEVRLDGFEPLDYKVYVVGDRTLTLHGDLRRVVP